MKSKSEIRDGRERITYSITDIGRAELKRWLMEPAEKEYVKYELLLKLFFGSILNADINITKIEDFKSRNTNNLNMMRLFKNELSSIIDHSNDHIYYYLTVLFGEKVYSAYMEWADEAINLLKSRQAEDNNK